MAHRWPKTRVIAYRS